MPLARHDYEYGPDFALSRWKRTFNTGEVNEWFPVHDAAGRLTKVGTLVGSFPAVRNTVAYDRADNIIGTYDPLRANRGYTVNNLNQVTGHQAGGVMRVEGATDEAAKVSVNGVPARTTPDNKWFAEVPVNAGANTLAVRAEDFSPNKNVSNKAWSVNVPSFPARAFTYDANGNLLDDGLRTYTWDAANRLVSVTPKPGSGMTAATYTFGYDGAGRRISEQVNGVMNRRWAWEPGGAEPAAELDAGGYGPRARYFAQGEYQYRSYAQYTDPRKFYYGRDHLGSVRELFYPNNGVARRFDYDPSGGRVIAFSDSAASLQFAYIEQPDFGFTGHFLHRPTNLTLTLYRAYDAETGRWLSRDPIWENGGVNLYGYVGGSPLMMTDPLGLYSWNEFIYDAAGVGLGVSEFALGVADGMTLGMTSRAQQGAFLMAGDQAGFNALESSRDSFNHTAGEWAPAVAGGAQLIRGGYRALASRAACEGTGAAVDGAASALTKFPKPGPTNPVIANMFKASPEMASEMRAGLSAAEREVWARHFSDVASRTRSDAGRLLNEARAAFLRGETNVPPGNITNFQPPK